MNRIYRKVWNNALGMWVVASELASGDARGAVVRDRRAARAHGLALAGAIALALGAGVLPTSAQAQALQIGDNAS
ncbi:ESPR domain-containing protein, partial [Xanthomonas sp. SHU 308]